MNRKLTKYATQANQNFWSKASYWNALRQGNNNGTTTNFKWFTKPQPTKGYGVILICLSSFGPLHAKDIKAKLHMKETSNDEIFSRLVRAELITSAKKGYKLTGFGKRYLNAWLGDALVA